MILLAALTPPEMSGLIAVGLPQPRAEVSIAAVLSDQRARTSMLRLIASAASLEKDVLVVILWPEMITLTGLSPQVVWLDPLVFGPIALVVPEPSRQCEYLIGHRFR
jgi:hypothetical protein